MHRILPAFALGLVSAAAVQLTIAQIDRIGAASLVALTAVDRLGKVIGTASGFIVSSDGLLITNCHVIDDASALTVTLANGDVYEETFVVDVDRKRDLA